MKPAATDMESPEKLVQVLVVDDHEVLLEGVKKIILRNFERVAVTGVATYNEALAKVHEHAWNLVITDLNINGRGGIDLIEEMLAVRKGMPVLVYTMHEEEELGVRAIKSGAFGFVRKGDPAKSFIDAISQILSGRKFISSSLAQSLVSYIRREDERPAHDTLSAREFQVLLRLAKGASTKEIAGELCLSVKTVSTYRSRILEKLQVKSLAEIVKYSLEHKLL